MFYYVFFFVIKNLSGFMENIPVNVFFFKKKMHINLILPPSWFMQPIFVWKMRKRRKDELKNLIIQSKS